ncbi:vitamin B12 ABC transporter substrate-binding protein BtuF [Candidatus Sodalis endolongispinus]|uniref:Vitamin B12-binding protein n=1 Tax=Candidatus Sodalis endolongispinus TaxID=2812662 RepID=A0ABS5YBJ7_9GAMM|nr:vitamin B12 ABC transporter substrate-binding protein BtuF [Candidatus Sodalis endolongispinus]MBT9432334.1 vitamin B12 ABC transporter substrate-binding protein BtuF [Candidatus Sodalis endolongispinus]
MRYRRAAPAALLCLLLVWSALAAQRVVSLAPHATELAYAADMGAVLVAASDWSDYPPAARRLERFASWQGVNIERILALKPDLVLGWRGGNPQRALETLAAFGIPVLTLDPQSIDEMADTLNQLVAYSPHPQQARQAASALKDQQATLEQRYAGGTTLRVFLQFGSRPLFTAGAATLQNQILALCGARNIFADSRVPWPQVSREQVLVRHPQVIVVPGDTTAARQIGDFWRPQLTVPVLALDEDSFTRPGPRILLATQQLCRQLAPIRAALPAKAP